MTMSETERVARGVDPIAQDATGARPEDVSFWHAFRPGQDPAGPAFEVTADGSSTRRRHPGLRWLFPSIWLIFLADPISALVAKGGVSAWVGVGLIVLFAACYALALPAGWSGHRRRFLALFGAMVALTVVVAPIAHEGTFSLFIYLAVLLVAGFRRIALWGVVVLTAVAVFLPVWAGWSSFDENSFENVITLPLVALAMYGFFSLVDTNRALAAARTEVVRLAAENERTRIARDLHDLLGHSLTTITVKVGLARKLAERDGSTAAVEELVDVEAVARRSLREVRAAVSGYTEVTLAGELATSRAVLRAAGIGADLPGAIDAVDPTRTELFGWVVREGVTNVVRHSRARVCRITLGPTWIEVDDDGHGIERLHAGADEGHGLSGLRERVEAVGGVLTSGGGGAGGWRLRVDVPA